jgi:UDPglucose 6-dehydrogenase
MDISIVGTGYVGLVSGTCLAAKGHRVMCVDVDEDKVAQINTGVSPIHEKGLEDLLRRTVGSNLSATIDLAKAVRESEISLIAVGTPFKGEEIDLRFVREVSRQIGEVLRDKQGYHVVVVKSTVVPGTTDEVVRPILEEASGKRAGLDFGVGMNPEFLREGEAVEDFMEPDRIVLGGVDERTLDVLQDMYAVFPQAYIIRTGNKTAEMIKYTANSLLATLISFSNEIGNLCTALGNVDVVDVMRGVHLDKRFCPLGEDGTRIVPGFTAYLEAGCGFGGSCFPKDVKALVAHGRKTGSPMRILESAIRINEEQPGQILALLHRHFPSLEGVRLAILGLAFKPGTDDMRESPSIPIIRSLLEQKARIKAYDPVAVLEARKIFGNTAIEYPADLSETVNGSQAVILLTKWEEFRSLPHLLNGQPSPPLLVDGRRMFASDCTPLYEGIGRRTV